MPYCEGLGRLIAPDLIGMGDSEKLKESDNNSYSFSEHARYLEDLFKELAISNNVSLILHDWGSALGFDWASKNPEKVRSIIYMEPVIPVSWDDWPQNAVKIFKGFRSESGEEMVLNKNLFIEAVLPNSILRDLDDDEMNEYRRPFLNNGEDRRPTLSWPRQLPIDSEPKEILKKFNFFLNWMKSNKIPKLLINGDPGSILTGNQREFCRSWLNQKETTVKGLHFLQEDSPAEIGESIKKFLNEINA